MVFAAGEISGMGEFEALFYEDWMDGWMDR